MMEKFDVVTGVAAPMLMNNINTDLIAPSHFPGKKPEEAVLMTLKDKMFANLRFHPDGAPQAGFRAEPDALQRCTIHPRRPQLRLRQFARDRGVGVARGRHPLRDRPQLRRHLPRQRPPERAVALEAGHGRSIERLANALQASNASELTVDLLRCELLVAGHDPVPFVLEDDRRLPLLEGLDQLAFMMRSEPEIAAFEQTDEQTRPWAYP